jgi:hypothetical protein
LATSPDATYQRSGWQLDSVVSELIYIAVVFVPLSYCEIDVLKEQCVCIEVCQKLGKTTTETYEILQQAFRETALSWLKTFEWYSQRKESKENPVRYQDNADRFL